MMHNVMFICLENYPTVGPCANVLKNICVAGKLADKVNIHVLAIKNSYCDVNKEIIDNVTIHRLCLPEFTAFKDFRKRKKKNLLLDILYCLRLLRRRILLKFFKSEFLLDNNIIRTISKIDGLRFEDIDVLIPVSGFFDATEFAIRLKEIYHNKLLILQLDPCASNAAYTKESLKNRQNFEQKMLDNADMILALPEQYIEYQNTLKNRAIEIKKIHVPNLIPNIADTVDKVELDTIACVFAGALYYGVRSPDYLFNLFSSINEVKLYLIGRYNRIIRKKISVIKNFIPLGPKSFTETKAILNSADFLVNLGNSVFNQVPSKIFDYISFGKPIIHIRKLENDPSMEYLNKYPLCLDLFEGDSIETNVAKLEDFISKNKGKRVDKDYIATTYKECTPEYCAEQLYQAILEVTHSGTQEEREAIE